MTTTITLADLFPCDEGTILVAKDVVDGAPRHISTVPNGLGCGCVCFGCGKRVVARNGGNAALRAHSFAHLSDAIAANCVSRAETALHVLGKEIIARHGRITLPATWLNDHEGRRWDLSKQRSVGLTNIRLEIADGEVIPDIVANTPDGRRIFIEIVNTHPCTPEKIDKLAGMDVDVLEIDLSGYRDRNLDDLEDIVLDLAPRRMIQSAALNAAAERLADEKRRQDDRERIENEQLIAVYRERATRNSPKAAELVAEILEFELSEYLDLDDALPSAFVVTRRQWQSAILYRVIATVHPAAVVPRDMVDRFRERGWVKPDLLFLKSERSRKIEASQEGGFKSAHEEILAYMKRLEKAGVVFERGIHQYSMAYDFRTRLKATSDKLEKQRRTEDRKQELLEVYRAIEMLMQPEDGNLWDFQFWLDGRAEAYGVSLEEFLDEENNDYHELVDQLATIQAIIIDIQRSGAAEPPEDFAGLPLDDLFFRLQNARAEAEDRAEAELAGRL